MSSIDLEDESRVVQAKILLTLILENVNQFPELNFPFLPSLINEACRSIINVTSFSISALAMVTSR